MSAALDKARADLEFYTEVLPLEEELEAAREDKANDPVRFADAKQAFEEKRTYYREIAQFLKEEADGQITPEPIHAAAEAIPVGDQ